MSLSDLICKTGQAARAKHERRKESRPGELLDAALDLFVAKGYAATRAEEVAAKAGVSKGTLFLYFKSKEELFEAVIRENIASVIVQGAAELEAFEGTTSELLRYVMFEWWIRFGSTKASGITKLIMSEASNFPALANFYQETVIAPLMFLTMWQHSIGPCSQGMPLDPQEFIKSQADILIHGVLQTDTQPATPAPSNTPFKT